MSGKVNLAYDYPILGAFWTVFLFAMAVLWFVLLFRVVVDIFRDDSMSGWAKTGWLLFVILLPFLGVFVYLISQNDGMNQRNLERAQAQRRQFDEYVRDTAGGGSGGGAASQIEQAKGLLDSGAITQAEFDALKAKALAT